MPPRLPARHRRAALTVLGRDRLAELAETFSVEVEDGRVLEDHINALVRSRRVDFGQLLRSLMREELQAICDALGVDRTGREKEVLVQRILYLGNEVDQVSGEGGRTRPLGVRMSAPVPTPASWGVATPMTVSGASEPLRMRTDGPCVSETLAQLERGFAGRPMQRDALERVRRQAEDILSEILQVYASDVAGGEVGANGSARAGAAPPLAQACPTGLLYGRIQSGKTNAMIVTTALALDNGFRTIVVFTSNFVKLVEQTLARFRVLDGPLIYSSTESGGGIYQWTQDIENIRRNIGQVGLVLICAKDASHQRALLELIRDVNAPEYPALIFDDEGDQATPDTTTAARSQLRAGAPQHGSVTFRLIVENDAERELGDSSREILRHNVFLQVTATPYALLLQNIDSPLRPKFTRLLEPGEGYTGGEHFFSVDQVRSGSPPLVFVDENEGEVLSTSNEIPDGLANAIAFFLISAATHQYVSKVREPEGYKFLCHTSPRTIEHDQAGQLIRGFVDGLSDEIRTGLSPRYSAAFNWAYRELLRSFPPAPPLANLIGLVAQRLHLRRVLAINSASAEAAFGPAFNFMVGGNILGRGLTIENLLTTYYLRRARTTQMDTMLQHARMYGYRQALIPFMRVFLPESLAVRFYRIHESESSLRDLLQDERRTGTRVPVRVAGDLRATRPHVLDPVHIGAYRSGQQVYPMEPEYRREQLGSLTERIEARLRDMLGATVPMREFVSIELERMIEFVRDVRTVDVEEGEWDPEALETVLRSMSIEYGGMAYLYVRDMRADRGPVLQTGAISGAEHEKGRSLERPVLFLLREAGARPPWDGVPFWYPTIVFPRTMPMQIFNTAR